MSTIHKITPKATMIAAFPTAISPVIGEPTARELIRVLRHIILCSQSHSVDYCRQNLLFLCVREPSWPHFSSDPWPTKPPAPGACPLFTDTNTVAQNANARNEWDYRKMCHQDCVHMNAALVERFLSLVKPQYHDEVNNELVNNPSVEFIEFFEYFTNSYGDTSEAKREGNRAEMKKEWHPSQGFQTLQK